MEIQAFDFPGRKLRFRSSAANSFEGVDQFCGDFISPLSAEVSFSFFDTEYGYALNDPSPKRPFWFLRSEQSPPAIDVRPAWENEIHLELHTLTSSEVKSWMDSVREGPGFDWREILIRSVRVRLPWSAGDRQEDTLQIRVAAHVLDYPVERDGESLFVSGPHCGTVVPPPLNLSLRQEMGVATMDIDVNWSVWTDPGQNGFADLQSAGARLRAAGWECKHSDIEGI